MAQTSVTQQRLENLEKLIRTYDEKLYIYQRERIVTGDVDRKFEMAKKIKEDIYPGLADLERQYASVLASVNALEKIPEATAKELVDDLSNAADSLEGKIKDPEEANALGKLKAELSKPETASAKLKLCLPIVPLIASYEITLETAGLMRTVWGRIKETFSNPPR